MSQALCLWRVRKTAHSNTHCSSSLKSDASCKKMQNQTSNFQQAAILAAIKILNQSVKLEIGSKHFDTRITLNSSIYIPSVMIHLSDRCQCH